MPTVAAGGRSMPLISVVGATVSVAAVPAVKDVHQRTQRKQDERQRAHQVGAVLREEEEPGHRQESGEEPGRCRPTLRAGA